VAQFEVQRHTGQSAVAVWELLTDWERHGDFIPFTTVRLTPSDGGDDRSSGFVARTSLGPLHFDDPMQITFWQPPDGGEPGVCRIVKRGRVVTGWAVLTVTPTVTGCTIVWREDAAVRYTGSVLAWPTKVAAGRVFGRLVDNLLGTPALG
jgi:hypothetical protein